MITGKNSTGTPQTLLPLLLSMAGKAVKIPLGEGDEIFISLIRLLGAITSNCDAAARQCFEDPSNFFLMDLASVGSDSLGVSSTIQTSVCFFLGNCFAALQDPISTSNSSSSSTEGSRTQDSTLLLNKKSFLSVIDTRIGLTRFNELLRRPFKVAHTANENNNNNNNNNNSNSSSSSGERYIDTTDNFFFTRGFEEFYRSQVESIRSAIFTFYSGGDGGMKSIMESQEMRIAELENLLVLNCLSSPIVDSSGDGGSGSDKNNINRGVNINDSNGNGTGNSNSNGDEGRDKDRKRGGDEGEWDWDGAEEDHQHQVEVEVESDEKGGLHKKRKAEGNSSRTIMTEEKYSLRITDLESSLYESDKEVIALQQALFEKQQQEEKQLQDGGGYNQFEMHRAGVEPSYDLKSDHSSAGMWSIIQSYIISVIAV